MVGQPTAWVLHRADSSGVSLTGRNQECGGRKDLQDEQQKKSKTPLEGVAAAFQHEIE